MDVPGIVRDRLGDERRMTSVNIGGDDRVYVTPPRTLVYHASGLFSRESIDEYSHDAQRFDVSASRREATFAFEYDDGVEAFSIPRERIETVLPPVLAGVLRTTGHIDDDESVEESYRFGERTVVVTDSRVLTSVGEAVWDHDHDSYAYENVTDLAFDDGDLVVVVDGRSRRIELDDDSGWETYETVEAALCAYHGVGSVDDIGRQPTETPPAPDSASDSDGASPTGSPDPTTETAPPNDSPESEPEPQPLSGRTDESAEPASQPSESTSQPVEAANEPSTTTDQPGEPVEGNEPTGSGNEPESDVVASPPPSSPSPGGPPAGPLIPEAPDAGGSNSGTGDVPADGDDASSATESEASAVPSAEATSGDTVDLASELDALRERVDHQHRLLERNQELLERLVEAQEAERLNDDQ